MKWAFFPHASEPLLSQNGHSRWTLPGCTSRTGHENILKWKVHMPSKNDRPGQVLLTATAFGCWLTAIGSTALTVVLQWPRDIDFTILVLPICQPPVHQLKANELGPWNCNTLVQREVFACCIVAPNNAFINNGLRLVMFWFVRYWSMSICPQLVSYMRTAGLGQPLSIPFHRVFNGG